MQILTQTHATMLSAGHSERRNAVQGVDKVMRKGDWCEHKSANTDSFPGTKVQIFTEVRLAVFVAQRLR